MIFIINNQISYDDSLGILTHIKTGDTIALPATAARIFSFLIARQGSSTTREQILSYIWEQYGFQASNNTLAQYISLIRKAIHTLGLVEEILVTLPRTGFILSKEINITIEDSLSMIDISADSVPTQVENTATHSLELSKTEAIADPLFKRFLERMHRSQKSIPVMPSKMKLLLTMLCILSTLLGGYIALKSQNIYTIHQDKFYLIGSVGTCPVYLLNASSKAMMPKQLETAKVISNALLPCWSGSVFYFQPEDSVIYGDGGRVFIARCSFSYENINNFSECKNVSAYQE